MTAMADDEGTDDGGPLTDGPLQSRVDAVSLEQTSALLLPSNLAVLPVFVVMAIGVRNHVPHERLAIWCAGGLVGEIVALVAWLRYRQSRARGESGLESLTLIRLSTAVVGSLWGVGLFVPLTANKNMMLLFAVFAYGASAFTMVLTTSRKDLYFAYEVPLFVVGTISLVTRHDTILYTLGAFALLYLCFATLVQRVANRIAVNAIESTWRTQQLMEGLAAEHDLLTSANLSAYELNHQLAHQATHDPLTNLFNRRGAIDALERALGEATLHQPVGLLYLDLDRFKQINDTLGHRGGDQFIAVVADRLQRSIDPGATAGRIGGDEFIAVLPNCDLGASMAVASRIASVLSQPVHAEGR
ncbi:MAG TPA: GGDEF domain-containing protein, partial [Ilumatobacteraceae bacterium]